MAYEGFDCSSFLLAHYVLLYRFSRLLGPATVFPRKPANWPVSFLDILVLVQSAILTAGNLFPFCGFLISSAFSVWLRWILTCRRGGRVSIRSRPNLAPARISQVTVVRFSRFSKVASRVCWETSVQAPT